MGLQKESSLSQVKTGFPISDPSRVTVLLLEAFSMNVCLTREMYCANAITWQNESEP